MTEIDELFDTFFNGGRKAQAAVDKVIPPAKTTDAPNIKTFMLQMINAYVRLVDADGMRWQKSFKHKDNGKQYRVTIILQED